MSMMVGKRVLVLAVLVGACLALPTELAGAANLAQTAESSAEYVRVTVDQNKCPNLCSGRGHCVRNTNPNAPPENTTICVCDQGWTGFDCSSVMSLPHLREQGRDCPNNCSSHGVCYRGSSVVLPRCYCDPHFTGVDCSRLREQVMLCINNCSGFGVCTEGFSDRHGNVVAKCLCDANHGGEDCSVEVHSTCPNACSGHGTCSRQGCTCDEGYIGADCSLRSLPSCKNNCSSQGRCSNGQCFCFPGFSGDDCSVWPKGDCKGGCKHGRCVADTQYFPGGCACDRGYFGKDCSEKRADTWQTKCGLDCSGHGTCGQDSTCVCVVGWTGLSCEYPTDNNLEGGVVHPFYMDGKSLVAHPTDPTLIVLSDQHPTCKGNCSSHGVCLEVVGNDAKVYDDEGNLLSHEGAKNTLPPNSKTFVCKCDPGFTGEDCSFALPPGSGISHITAANVAKAPEVGAVAQPGNNRAPKPLFVVDQTSWDKLPTMNEIKLKNLGCPHNCSSRGRCVRDQKGFPECSCYPGWGSTDCSQQIPKEYSCTLQCQHGRCVTASEYFPVGCLCDKGWTGELCTKRIPTKLVYDVEEGFCPNHCSHRGLCANGKCVCLEMGWGGPDCSVQAGGVCEHNCHGNGICFWGTCECMGGYSGQFCDIEPSEPCPNECHMRGKCVGGVCTCMSGFTGDDCSEIMVECPSKCSGHGSCVAADPKHMRPAQCECAEGWTGLDCSNFPLDVPIPKEEAAPTTAQRYFEDMKESQRAEQQQQ